MVKMLNDSLAEAFFGHITEVISGKNLTFLQMARLLASETFHYLLMVLSSFPNLGVTVRRTRDRHAGKYFYDSIDDCFVRMQNLCYGCFSMQDTNPYLPQNS